jgi:hypothetical protein
VKAAVSSRELVRIRPISSVGVVLDHHLSARLAKAERGLATRVADGAVPPQPPLEHPQEHRDFAINVIVDPNLGLARVETVQPSRVLHERALPGDGQGQKQRVEACIVEALANVATRGQDQMLLIGRNRGKLVPGSVPPASGMLP